MKKLSERAVVQYLSISAIAWHWRRRRRWRRWRRRRRLHVHRGLYGSAVAAITSPAMAPRRRQWWRLDTVFLRALDAVRHSLAKRPGGHFFAFISVHLLRRGSRGPHSLNQQFFHACHDRGDQQISTRLINVFFRQS